jgi:hypothetical protein
VVEAGTVQRNHIKNGDGDCGIQQEVERAGVGGLWSDDVDDGAELRAQQRPSVAKEVTEKQTLQACKKSLAVRLLRRPAGSYRVASRQQLEKSGATPYAAPGSPPRE